MLAASPNPLVGEGLCEYLNCREALTSNFIYLGGKLR
jgi:hypothetical protein